MKKETLDASLPTIIGSPVIIQHKDVTEENADELRCGVIANAQYNELDGWYYVDGIIWDDKAQELINKGWSVSCSYDFLAFNDEGGEENNIHYDKEFTQLNFTHLAIVDNPRYERANIVFNSKVKSTEVNNEDKWITKHPNGEDGKGKHLLLKDGETPKEAIERTYGKVEKSSTKDKESYDKAKGRAQKALDLAKKAVEGKELSKQEKDWLNSNKSADELRKDKRPQKPKEEQISKISDDELSTKIKELAPDSRRWEWESNKKEITVYFNDPKSKSADRQWDKLLDGLRSFGIKDVMVARNSKTNNSKETDMAIIEELKKLITKVENTKGEEEMEIENEKVDKRKLIDEVAGIMKSAGCDDEDIRTAIGKMEKIGYDDSEASADNKKVKNEVDEEEEKKVDNEDEEDEEKVEDLEEEEKKDVKNKCKNSKEESYFDKLNKIYNSAKKIEEPSKSYESRQSRLEAGEKYFG